MKTKGKWNTITCILVSFPVAVIKWTGKKKNQLKGEVICLTVAGKSKQWEGEPAGDVMCTVRGRGNEWLACQWSPESLLFLWCQAEPMKW